MKKKTRKPSRHLPAFLLLFLRDKKLYGGQLLNKINQITDEDTEIDGGSVYRTLRELEADGLIRSDWVIRKGSKPIRIYKITESGLAELDLWYKDICVRKKTLEFFIKEYESGETDV